MHDYGLKGLKIKWKRRVAVIVSLLEPKRYFSFDKVVWVRCTKVMMAVRGDVDWRPRGTCVAQSSTNKLETSPKYLQS
jgi:hypothetical protein